MSTSQKNIFLGLQKEWVDQDILKNANIKDLNKEIELLENSKGNR